MGLRTQTGLTSKFSVTPRFSLSLSLYFSLFALTCVVFVPHEDRSKLPGQFVERVFIHAIYPPKAEPEGAPRFLRSAMAQPISRLPLLLSATCGTAYDAFVCRCYTYLERTPKLGG